MTYRLIGALGPLMIGLPLMVFAATGDGLTQQDGTGRIIVADKGADLPLSRDALFDVVEPVKAPAPIAAPATKDDLFGIEPIAKTPLPAQLDADLPATRDALFADEASVKEAKKEAADQPGASPIRGFLQTEIARTYADPEHWSKVLGRLELGTQGRFGQDVKWKLSGRLDYNAVYDLTDFYQSQVRDDQRLEFQLRETYLDFSAGDWEWRLGRQHIVWGEMVGLFFADVVSAKDLREFVLPDFEMLRIPQWAARAEYFKDDFHAELVWIPFPSYDEIGQPRNFLFPGSGADFYPYPPAIAPTILGEVKPGNNLEHTNYGVRLSTLNRGWDLSGFYYSSMNSAPTFYRTDLNTFTPRHDRIWQLGGTLAKDFRDFVFKAEMVYTDGRRYNLRTNLVDADGVVEQDTLDWVVGLDFNPAPDTRVNTQLFQRHFFDHVADIVPDQRESGVSLLVNHRFSGSWSAEALLVHSLNRSDWMLRPKAIWRYRPDWRLTFGVDVFQGPPDGLFGQYDHQDRGYMEVRHDF
jgi:hypothetical protein